MRVLITPMAAMAETSGPFSRSVALCHKLLETGHEVALCAALDVNYHTIDHVQNYDCPVPYPLGLPKLIGKTLLKIAQLSGAQKNKKVNSFEQVLFFVGALNKKHFQQDVICIRQAIQEFKPDLVYSEFRPAAIVAAKLENVKIAAGYSFPVQKTFASNPEYSNDIQQLIKEYNLPDIESVLDIFDWADLKIVPSSYELEPIEGENILFVGPFIAPAKISCNTASNKIIAYMGSGTVSPKLLIHELTKAFQNTNYEVYIATEQVQPFTDHNIIVDKRFDFGKLMPGAVAYINHGGQNSIMTGLIYGVPQIVCPGNVFERKYNANSIVKIGAGTVLETENFSADAIKAMVSDFENQPSYQQNAKNAGEKLMSLGGTDQVIQAFESM